MYNLFLEESSRVTIALILSFKRKWWQPRPAANDLSFVGWHQLIGGHPALPDTLSSLGIGII